MVKRGGPPPHSHLLQPLVRVQLRAVDGHGEHGSEQLGAVHAGTRRGPHDGGVVGGNRGGGGEAGDKRLPRFKAPQARKRWGSSQRR